MCEKASVASFPVDYEALDREFNEKCWEIKKLKQNILELEAEIDECHDMRNSPQHVYLHEAIMLNVEKLDEIEDNNWEEMLELKTQAIKFGYNMMERLEIRISNNEQLETFQNGPKILVSPSTNESDLSSLEDDYTFTRKVGNNVKFHARKVQGYKDISQYFQAEPKPAKVERKRLKSEDAETQTEDELDMEGTTLEEELAEKATQVTKAEIEEARVVESEAGTDETKIEEDPNDILDEIPDEAKQRRRSSAKEIVKKLERSTSIEERFQQVVVKNTNVDIMKYFQPQPKQENCQLKNEAEQESKPKETIEFLSEKEDEREYENEFEQQYEIEEIEPVEEDSLQDEIFDYFQRHKSLDEMEDVDGKFEEAFAQLGDEIQQDFEEPKPKLSVRERVKRINSTVEQKDEENVSKSEELVEVKLTTAAAEIYIDENHNEEMKPKLSVRERIKRMNEGELEESAGEKDVVVQNRVDQEEVANVQLKNLKQYFEKSGFPLVFK